MKVGEILEVIADDPASEEDIPHLIKNIEQELIEVNFKNDEFHFLIKKLKTEK